MLARSPLHQAINVSQVHLHQKLLLTYLDCGNLIPSMFLKVQVHLIYAKHIFACLEETVAASLGHLAFIITSSENLLLNTL